VPFFLNAASRIVCSVIEVLLLANIIGEELLTAEELKQFSHEVQARIKMISELHGT